MPPPIARPRSRISHERCDLILVIGAQNSSNSQRLREVAEACGTRSYLIDDDGISCATNGSMACGTVGMTAGASAPEVLVDRVITALAAARRAECGNTRHDHRKRLFPPTQNPAAATRDRLTRSYGRRAAP